MIDIKTYLLQDNTWVEQKDVIYPMVQSKTLDESYDTGNVTVYGIPRREPFPAFAKCKMVARDLDDNGVGYTDTQYYFAHDTTDQLTMIEPYLYNHVLSLTEPTKWLERFVVAGMSVTQPLRPNVPLSISLGGLNGAELTVVLPDGAMTYALPSNGKVQIPVPAVKKGEQKYRYEAIIGDTKYTRSDAGYLEVPYNGEAKFTVTIHNPSGGSVDFATTYDIMTTAPQKSVADVIDDLLAITPFRRYGEPPMFHLDETIRERLSRVNSCEFRWSCKMTLFECLHEVGKFIGAMPRLTANPQDDRKFDTITFDFFGELRNSLEKLEYSALQFDRNEASVCGELETYAENLIAQADEPQSTTTWPSKNGWVTCRADDVRVVEDNTAIILPEKIERIIKLLVKNFQVDILVRRPDGTLGGNTTGYIKDPIDINKFVLPYEKWQLLKEAGTVTEIKGGEYWKNNTLYYEKNSNNIYPLNKSYNHLLTQTPIIKELITTYFKNDGEKSKKDVAIVRPDGSVDSGEFQQSRINIADLQFQIEYIPLSTAKIKAIKSNHNDGGTLIYNQQAEYNDSRNMGANMWGTCQAMGTDDMRVGLYYKKIGDIPQIGDTYGDYIVTSVERTIKSLRDAAALLTLSRDFNRLNERVSVDKKYRQWNIPADGIEAHYHYQEYVEISDRATPNTSMVTAKGIEILKNTFETKKFDGNTELDCATLQGNSGGTWLKKVLLPIQSRAFAKSIAFTFAAQDNYSAGVQKNGDEIIDVGYADENGCIDYAGIDFGADINAGYSPDQLPYCPNGITAIMSSKFPIKKDAAARFAMTYQLHFISTLPDIVIGDMLAERCPLVRSFDGPKVFQLWRLNKRVSKFTQKITQEYGAMVGNANITTAIVNSSIRVLIDTPSSGVGWAITDAAGNLYLAENAPGGSTKTFYLNLKKQLGY